MLPKDPPWSMVHAHFLQMGGFRLLFTAEENVLFTSEQEPQGPLIRKEFTKHRSGTADIYEANLTFDSFKRLLLDKRIKLPTISEAELNDKSKADAISKGIALLQTAWFVIQVVARVQQNLAISELELTTAALAGLNSIMYLCWWNKPLAIRFPVFVHTEDAISQLQHAEGDACDLPLTFPTDDFSLTSYLWHAFVLLPIKTLADLRKIAMRVIGGCFTISLYCLMWGLSEGLRKSPSSSTDIWQKLLNVLTFIPKALKVFPKLMFHALSGALILPLIAITGEENVEFVTIHRGTESVTLATIAGFTIRIQDKANGFTGTWLPFLIFYGQKGTGPLALFLSSSMAGVLFGAAHCLAWDFQFPTHIVQVTWRVSSVCVVAVCALILIGRCTLGGAFKFVQRLSVEKFGPMILYYNPFIIIPAVLYLLSRIILFSAALISLRHLPESAFETIHWVDTIPHL